MSTMFTIDEYNVDMNTLISCNFTYNFDALKTIISVLVKNQRHMEERLNKRDKTIEKYK